MLGSVYSLCKGKTVRSGYLVHIEAPYIFLKVSCGLIIEIHSPCSVLSIFRSTPLTSFWSGSKSCIIETTINCGGPQYLMLEAMLRDNNKPSGIINITQFKIYIVSTSRT